MTRSPLQDAVAIDTNIFEHLLNPQNNECGHINSLLVHLQEKEVKLLLDDDSRIRGEYEQRISPIIKGADDTRNEIFILRYWMYFAPTSCLKVNGSDELMTIIKSSIVEPQENVDRFLVYVALSQGKVLISNDRKHILCGPPREGALPSRRHRLLQDTKRRRQRGADILSSREANRKAHEYWPFSADTEG